MYTHYFQLKQAPFSIAPDPRYLFMSERHREALAHLLYGVGSGGFVLLTGDIGAGKTTVCRCFMEQLPDHCSLAYIVNPKLSVDELLLSIAEEFGLATGIASVKTYVDAINAYLLRNHALGKSNVLIIDEAQNLSIDVLEQLRLLTNLETNERKLLHIILIGQPELRTLLARPELEQLAQRVLAHYHLGPLSAAETAHYVAHRLAVAGSTAVLFSPRVLRAIFQRSQGVPRRINLLCDRALLGAYAEHQRVVTRSIVRKAGAEVFAGRPARTRPLGLAYALLGVLAGVLLTGAVLWDRRAAAPVSIAPVTLAVAPVPPVPLPVPVALRAHMTLGDQGVDVDWIGQRLAQLNGLQAPPKNQLFDAEMQRLLRQFQTSQQLEADGVAGPQTLIRLLQPASVAGK